MKEAYCCKCGLRYWTPKGEKEIDHCPFCGRSDNAEKNRADNLDIADKMRILGISVSEKENKNHG
jgi:hypothetical protein